MEVFFKTEFQILLGAPHELRAKALLPLPLLKVGSKKRSRKIQKIQKRYNHVRHPLSSAIFHQKLTFFLYRQIKMKIHFNILYAVLLTIIKFLKVALIDLIAILMLSAKLAIPDLLKLTAF